jgi:uncharacterized protein (DUF1015 family)
MINFLPFKALSPLQDKAKDVAALPYDVFNQIEAKIEVNEKPYSFLRIDRAETNFDDNTYIYSEQVYKKASSLLNEWIDKGILIQDDTESFYLYELKSTHHQQTGIVGLTAVNDMMNGSIKDHELTRKDKQIDRINHIDYCNAHTGPILMFYKDKLNFGLIIESIKDNYIPIIDIVSDDAIRHRVFRISNISDQNTIKHHFNTLNALYIADGHHRAAAAKAIALKRDNQDVTDLSKSSNLFLSVVFPETQLKILDYNRVIKDLNHHEHSEFLSLIERNFEIINTSSSAITPLHKGFFSMYLLDTWYLLRYKNREQLLDSPIDLLDVSILQNTILNPILGITDPITDSRIDFVGGIKGLDALQTRVQTDCKVAFALVPTSIDELIQISDLGHLMPPKSTWFEPKLRSGLFIHLIDD